MVFGHLVDVDMRCAHVGFALDLVRICQFENMCGNGAGKETLSYVKRWRDETQEVSALLRAAGVNEPKKAVLKIMYGGAPPEVGAGQASRGAAEFLKGFVADTRFLRWAAASLRPDSLTFFEQRNDAFTCPMGSNLFYLLSGMEDVALMFLVVFWP